MGTMRDVSGLALYVFLEEDLRGLGHLAFERYE